MAYVIDHRDIWIESSESLSWRQEFDDALNYDNLDINQSSYTDYQPTNLQFHLSSATVNQSIRVKVPYRNRLERIYAKNAVVCRYDSIKEQWDIVKHTLDKENQVIEFTTSSIGIYCIFVNQYWYSSFTQRMADEYPNWTKVRNDRKSVGQQFLNYFGIEFETIHDYLEWISEQKYIGTADITMLDWIYMYQLPKVKRTDDIELLRRVGPSIQEIPLLETLREFFYNDTNQGAIIDYDESKLYTTIPYGDIVLNITRGGKKETFPLTPIDYHIWNTFDEFGLLLGVERLHLEKNEAFKERILDVFRYPSGTHDEGLTNGIARDLNLIQRKDKHGRDLIWQDDSKDFLLKNTTGKIVDIKSLRVDDQPLEDDAYTVDEVGNIRIYALHQGDPHTISFIYGVDKYQLYDKSDEELYKMMMKPDGQATPLLLKWVEYINTVAPVMWDRFKWDEGFWDTIDKELTGLGYVPNIWDSDISSWKDYVFESDR